MKNNEFVQQNVDNMAAQRNNNELKLAAGSIMFNTAKQFTVLINTLDKNANATLSIANQVSLLNTNFSKQFKIFKDIAGFATLRPSASVVPMQRDIRFKEDPDKEMRSDIDSVDKTLKSMLGLQKSEKKSSGILPWIGGAMALGGLLGYLFTGKNEFLMDTVKGFKWMAKAITLPFKIAKTAYSGLKAVMGVGHDIANAGKGMFKFIKTALGLNVGDFSKVIKPIKQMFAHLKFIGELFKTFGFKETFKLLSDQYKSIGIIKTAFTGIKAFFGSVKGFVGGIKGLFSGMSHIGSSILKGIGTGLKTAGKSALKKIPIFGTLMGIAFGIMRFSKGDILGGLLELASGVVGIVPVAGTIVSLAIDSYLLFRDFKKSDVEKREQSSNAMLGLKRLGKEALKAVPIVGTFIRLSDGFALWKAGKKTAAIKEFGLGLASLFPAFGPLLSIADSIIGYVTSNKIESASATMETGGDNLGSAINITPVTANDKEDEYGVQQSYSENFMSDLGTNNKYKGIKASMRANFEGLNDKVKFNFVSMADEYYKLTGKSIGVNSARRNGGGGSLHDAGLAVDIQSSDASALESLGLMQKYKFHRPLLNWKNNNPNNPEAKNEPWHVEPYPGNEYGDRNTNNYLYRTAKLRDNPNPVIISPTGDGGYGVSKRIRPNTVEDSEPMELSDKTIEKLGVVIAKNSDKFNISNRTVIATTDGRSNF